MKENNCITKKQVRGIVIWVVILCVSFLLVYKAQLGLGKGENIDCTLMWEHKENNKVELSADKSNLTEEFTCEVPKLKMLTIECKGKKIDSDARLVFSLTDAETGTEYYNKDVLVKNVVNKKKNQVQMKLKKAVADSEGKQLVLSVELLDARDTKLIVTSNYKAGIVTSFNGLQDDKTNIIYSLQYSNVNQIKNMYVPLCILLLLLGILCYYYIVIRQASIEKFYVPVALLMGVIFQFVITVYGVPDEPWHMDTAYKLSNKILFVEDSEEPGTLLKRQCDIQMSDMLANGVESNSYYQLLNHTFEKAEHTDLVKTTYTDSSNLVPDFIFFSTALGISIGRLFGLSALLTMQLGRIMNLLVFVMLTGLAIRKIPFGKNMLGAIGMLPITLQQAASASYDAMIIAIVFLFIAVCLQMKERKSSKKTDIILLLTLIVLLALVKGGVYLPVVLLLLVLAENVDWKKRLRNAKPVWLIGGVCGIVVVLIMAVIKILPMLHIMMQEVDGTDAEALYTLPYLLKHPLNGVYLYWNTIMKAGAKHLAGVLGGVLGWHDVQISWILIIPVLTGILLFVNVDGDKYIGTRNQKYCITLICIISIVLIMLSMLLALTTLEDANILGLQGRYYLPIAPLLFFLSSNSMVRVNEKQCRKIWMMLIFMEIMIGLQFVVGVIV